MQSDLMKYVNRFWSRQGVSESISDVMKARPFIDRSPVVAMDHLNDEKDSWDNHTIIGYLTIDGPVMDLVCSCGEGMGVTFGALVATGMSPVEMLATLKQLGVPEVPRPDPPEVSVVLPTVEINIAEQLTPEALAIYDTRLKQSPAGSLELRQFTKKVRLGDGKLREEYVAKIAVTFNRLVKAKLAVIGVLGPVVLVELPFPQRDLVDILNQKPLETADAVPYGLVIFWIYSDQPCKSLNAYLGNQAFVESGTVGDEDWTGL